jgi:hypothetical protein
MTSLKRNVWFKKKKNEWINQKEILGKQLVADLMTRISSKDQSNQGRSGQYRCGVVCKAAWKTFTRDEERGGTRILNDLKKEKSRGNEFKKKKRKGNSKSIQRLFIWSIHLAAKSKIAERSEPTENLKKRDVDRAK